MPIAFKVTAANYGDTTDVPDARRGDHREETTAFKRAIPLRQIA